MILIGQYDSPFVRRVAIAMRRYGMAYEHRTWAVFGDADKIAAHNPLRRVPTLILEGGETLVESWAILDAIDEMVGPDRALLPASGPVRRDGMRIAALATGFADKSGSLYHESLFRSSPSEFWMARCRSQMTGTLDVLESDRGRRTSPWWLGEALSHADIAVACALRFTQEAHPGFVDQARWPRLSHDAARAEALEEFRAVYQPFVVRLRA
jgi:glutathione S-transferase